MPWEGAADQYRDILYHGGIFGSGFIVGWFTTHMAHHMLGRAYENNPDTFQDNVLWRFMRNSLDSGMFKSPQAQWDKKGPPMWAGGNWAGMGPPPRGATAGHIRAASKGKKLRSHSATIAGHGGHISGPARDAGISLVTPPLAQDTEITGPLMAKLWVSSTTEDMDLLLTLRNIDPAGNDVLEVGQQGQPVPVAKGWLRVSHRELDPDLSLPYRPSHNHLRRLWLKPNHTHAVPVVLSPTSLWVK